MSPPPPPVQPRPRSRNRGLIVLAIVGALALIGGVAIAVVSLRKPTPPVLPVALPAVSSPSPSPSLSPPPETTSPPSVSTPTGFPLIELLPREMADPRSRCGHNVRLPQLGSTNAWESGLAETLECGGQASLNGGTIRALRYDSHTDYLNGWQAFEVSRGYIPAADRGLCPPTDFSLQGTVTYTNWVDSSQSQGHVLRCWYNKARSPVFTWTYPNQNALVTAVGGPGMTADQMKVWWERLAAPASPPAIPIPTDPGP